MLNARGPEPPLDDKVGLGESSLDVAFAHFVVDKCVVVAMNLGGVRPERGFGVGDDGQGFVIDLDQVQSGLGDFSGLGGDQREAVTKVADLVAGKDGLVLDDDADDSFAGDVLGSKHGFDTVQLFGFGGIDAQDAGVGMLGAEDFAPELVGKVVVGGKLCLTGDLAEGIDAPFAFPDDVGIWPGTAAPPADSARECDLVSLCGRLQPDFTVWQWPAHSLFQLRHISVRCPSSQCGSFESEH